MDSRSPQGGCTHVLRACLSLLSEEQIRDLRVAAGLSMHKSACLLEGRVQLSVHILRSHERQAL